MLLRGSQRRLKALKGNIVDLMLNVLPPLDQSSQCARPLQLESQHAEALPRLGRVDKLRSAGFRTRFIAKRLSRRGPRPGRRPDGPQLAYINVGDDVDTARITPRSTYGSSRRGAMGGARVDNSAQSASGCQLLLRLLL